MPFYISEYQNYGYADTEFIELAVPTGTDVSGYSVAIYDGDGNLRESWSLGSLQSTTNGHDVYLVNSATPGFDEMGGQGEIYSNSAIAFVDDTGGVIQFVSHWGNTITANDGPAAGMTSVNLGTASAGQSYQSDDFGASYYIQNTTNPGTIPACFAEGTLIDTPDGARPVEQLRAGDLVTTLTGAPCPISWTWQGPQPLDGTPDDGYPVLIRAGALGAGLPARDLIVSPQHRMYVGTHGILQRFFDAAALVPAKALTCLPGIRHMRGRKSIVWHHFACDPHQIVLANECPSESLLLGPVICGGLSAQQRLRLGEIFGDAGGGDYLNGPPAAPLGKVGATRRHIRAVKKARPGVGRDWRHGRNGSHAAVAT